MGDVMKVNVAGFFKKLRTLLVMGLLIIALSVLNFFLGCEIDKEEPKAYYGPPLDDLQEQDVDNPADIYIDQTAPDQMQTYYGPMPVDVVEDTPDPETDLPRTYYGPVPVDVIEDTPQPDPDAIQTLYGPVPVDVVEDVPDPQNPDATQAYYGPMPVDVKPVDDIADVEEDKLQPDAMQTFYGPSPQDPK
jgi:hypothetical protein